MKPIAKFRHYKGNEYWVLHLAKCADSLERTVVYTNTDYADPTVWTLPLEQFKQTVVNADGLTVPRFKELR